MLRHMNLVKDVCVGCGGNVYDYILDQFEHKGATLWISHTPKYQ